MTENEARLREERDEARALLREAVALLKAKMNPLRNNQATHDAVWDFLDRVEED